MARLLVVDDEPALLLLMRAVLEKAGHAVETAADGREALAKMGVEPADPAAALPELVLLDVMMPVMDGPAMAAALHADPRGAAVPILVVSAKPGLPDLFGASHQVVGFLKKPFDPSTLREAVLRALKKPD